MGMGKMAEAPDYEIAKSKLVRVENGVRPGQPGAPRRVVPFGVEIREQKTARPPSTRAASRRRLPVRQVLDYRRRQPVEACVPGTGIAEQGAFEKTAGRPLHRCSRAYATASAAIIASGDAQGLLRQRGRAVTRAATASRIRFPGQAQCERIAGQVLVPRGRYRTGPG